MAAGIKTKIFLFCLVLFSKELFALARFPQLSIPSVQLHIEDSRAGVQRSSRQKKLLKMQNEPNFTMHPPKLSAVLIETYNERALPDMTKTNPIEPNTNPKRTQFQNGQKQTPTSVVARTYN